MPGSIFNTINPAVTSGNQLATLLNDFRDIITSGFGGTTRPTNLLAGGYWVDTTYGASPNFYWDVKIYTGTADVAIYRINLDTNTASITGAEEVFTISKTSADTVGPILKLLKERIASNGQVVNGDVVGEVQFFGADDADGNPVVAKLKCVASDTMTTSASGAYLVLEATVDGTATRVEMLRIADGKIGVGGIAPDNIIHARGASGIKSENRADDTVGAKVVVRKRRVSGSEQVLSGDEVGSYLFNSSDDAGAEIEVAKIVATATENHTSTAQGSDLSLQTKAIGASVFTEIVKLTTSLADFKKATKQVAIQLDKQDVASTASIIQLSATKAIVNITGSTETYLRGINSGSDTKVIVIHNSSTANIFVTNEDAAATAADRIKLPKAKTIKVIPESSIELFYESGASRWKVKSGSGSGGGEPVVIVENTLADSGTLTLQDEASMLFLVEGASTHVTLATAALGSTVLGTNGAEICIMGTSDDKTVTINSSTGSKGIRLNGGPITLASGHMLTLKWISSLDLYTEKSRSH